MAEQKSELAPEFARSRVVDPNSDEGRELELLRSALRLAEADRARRAVTSLGDLYPEIEALQ